MEIFSFQRIFSNRGQQINTSYFAKHNGPTFPFRFCSSNELKHYDESEFLFFSNLFKFKFK